MSRAAPTQNSDLTDRQLAQLARLAEIGMEIAEAAGLQARGEGEGAGADAALSFSRAARAVRLTIALETRLVAERAALQRGEAAVRASEASRRRDRIHVKVDRLIDEVAQTEGEDAEVTERLSEAVWERLTETDDEDLLDRPIEEIVARICADLGLAAGWAAEAFPVTAAATSAVERPLSQAGPDSSPVLFGTGEQAPTSILLPCEAGEVAAEGRRRGPAPPHPPQPSTG